MRWIATATLMAGALVLLVRQVFSEERVLLLLDWVGRQGMLAPLLFVALQCLFVVGLAPGFLLSFASGFLFGFWLGLACVWAGTLLGAVVAFALSPLFFQKHADRMMGRVPLLARLNRGFASDGWKLAMLRCLIPLFPFKLSNYAFGVSRIALPPFAFGTALGIIPIAAFNVYLGSVSAELSLLGAAAPRHSALEWAVIGAGGAAIVVTFLFVTRRAQSILNQEPEEPSLQSIHLKEK